MARAIASAAAYLRKVPAERRVVLRTLRAVIRKILPRGYREQMQYGMIAYVVPLARYPAGYLNRADMPLPYVAVAAMKNHLALHLYGLYADRKAMRAFVAAYRASGKPLDMGKSCLRFRRIEDLSLPAIERAIAAIPADRLIELYAKARRR